MCFYFFWEEHARHPRDRSSRSPGTSDVDLLSLMLLLAARPAHVGIIVQRAVRRRALILGLWDVASGPTGFPPTFAPPAPEAPGFSTA